MNNSLVIFKATTAFIMTDSPTNTHTRMPQRMANFINYILRNVSLKLQRQILGLPMNIKMILYM